MFNKIKLDKLTSGFNFDQQLRLSCVKNNLNIEEIAIKTIYGTERSSVHFVYATRYLFELIRLCKDRNIKVLEDASESLGTIYNKGYLKNAPKSIVQNDKDLLKDLTIEDNKLRSIVSSID